MEFKIIIIEDEALALSRLKRLLAEQTDSFEVVAELTSVQEALQWFSTNDYTKISLIFADIQLNDGISFETFNKINLSIPIIFTTAFDQYLLQAFKTYGIEYLLKPFDSKDIASAIQKYKAISQHKSDQKLDTKQYIDFFRQFQPTNFPTFISYNREQIIPIKSENMVYFSLFHQIVYAFDEQKKWVLNESLNQIQEKLPSYHFYRANRQIIVNRKYIGLIENYFGGKLIIKLTHQQHEEIIISKDNAKSFKDWLQS